MRKNIDITGQKFNRLLALRKSSKPRNWEFICDCGTVLEAYVYNVVSGKTRSCGCLHRQIIRTHNKSKTVEYRAWQGMKKRCFCAKHKHYIHYGGRGITVCERWRDSFENFLADVGPKPSQKHSLDRIDNNGNYEPSNCRWATQKQQTRNTRRNVFVVIGGVSYVYEDACGLFNVSRDVVNRRKRVKKITLQESFEHFMK